MLRLRFLPGLILGLVLGLPAGVLIGMLTLSPRGTSDPTATSLHVQELTRKLDAANEAKERAERQFEQFQKLAEQMTASFNELERRFKALEEEQRRRESQGAQTSQRPAAGAAQGTNAVPSKVVGGQPASEAPAPKDPVEAGKAEQSGTDGSTSAPDPTPSPAPSQ